MHLLALDFLLSLELCVFLLRFALLVFEVGLRGFHLCVRALFTCRESRSEKENARKSRELVSTFHFAPTQQSMCRCER
ncbi:MAG TPA: hypothetical protein VM580_24340, partial [Labilithrix sp.]|nr:hypothetical protein [Labilithrix sp.]